MDLNKLDAKFIVLFLFVAIILLASISFLYFHSPSENPWTYYAANVLFTICSIFIGNVLVIIYKKGELEELVISTNLELKRISDFLHLFKSYGLIKISLDSNDVLSDDLFKDANNIKLAFKSNVSWLNNNSGHLSTFAKSKHNEINVILPNPKATTVINEIAKQRGEEPHEVKKDIEAAVGIIQKHFLNSEARCIIRHTDTVLFSHYYIFSDIAVMTMRSFQDRSSGTPHLKCAKNRQGLGEFFLFCEKQFDDLWHKRSVPCWDNLKSLETKK